VLKAANVFDEIMAAPDKTIPKAILDKAEAIAVFPGMLRAGFIFGGQRGKGVISVRNRKTGAWSAPAFLTITGGSWGAQLGGQSIDLVLVIRDEKGLNNFLGNQFKIGAEASAAAGPVGRSAEAATDVQMRAQILSYSRSRGLFAGIALNGSSVHQDVDANERMYGGRYTTRDIVIDRRGGSPGAIGPWRDVLSKYVGR
jgi:lipid-binding SYLF domain-containing protein